MKNFIWIGVIILAIVVLMFWGKQSQNVGSSFEVGVIHPQDHIKGNASSTVILTEYSDFQCPACRSYYPVVREIMAEYGDRIVLVYRYFPLTGIHLNAEVAARAAEAASKQGKFWEMHDLLFEKQNEWAEVPNVTPMFESYATLLGISIEQFKTDFGSSAVRDFVRAQRLHAIAIGLQGTPSFFINGEQIQNPSSVAAFKTLIEEALKKK